MRQGEVEEAESDDSLLLVLISFSLASHLHKQVFGLTLSCLASFQADGNTRHLAGEAFSTLPSYVAMLSFQA